MGIPVLIIGKSGSGKTASLQSFGPGEISIVNVLGKPLPFRCRLKTCDTDDYGKIRRLLANGVADSVCIDDAGYLLTNMFMREHASYGTGSAIFALYNKIGDSFWGLVESIKAMPKNKIVYLTMHEDKSDFGDVKPKTIGKLLDDKVCLEGMFTIVLRAVKEEGRHLFLTKARGYDVTKSPIGMFGTEAIENDLKAVDDAIRAYYGIERGKA